MTDRGDGQGAPQALPTVELAFAPSRGEPPLEKALRTVRGGGLVVVPTETFYAIACDAWSREAVRRLLTLMGRDFGKPIPLIAGSFNTVQESTSETPPRLRAIARQFWPGPLILVLHGNRFLPPAITAGTGAIGIRIPGQSVALELARGFGHPLTAVGACLPGKPPARSVSQIPEEIMLGVDLVIDGGWTTGYQPATVLSLMNDLPLLIREGPLGRRVADFLNDLSWREEKR